MCVIEYVANVVLSSGNALSWKSVLISFLSDFILVETYLSLIITSRLDIFFLKIFYSNP